VRGPQGGKGKKEKSRREKGEEGCQGITPMNKKKNIATGRKAAAPKP
jgi:hypothetical protein